MPRYYRVCRTCLLQLRPTCVECFGLGLAACEPDQADLIVRVTGSADAPQIVTEETARLRTFLAEVAAA